MHFAPKYQALGLTSSIVEDLLFRIERAKVSFSSGECVACALQQETSALYWRLSPLVALCSLLPLIILLKLAFCASHLAWNLKLSKSLSWTVVFQLFICSYSLALHFAAFHGKLVKSLRTNGVYSTSLIFCIHKYIFSLLLARHCSQCWEFTVRYRNPLYWAGFPRSRSGDIDSCASSLFGSWCPSYCPTTSRRGSSGTTKGGANKGMFSSELNPVDNRSLIPLGNLGNSAEYTPQSHPSQGVKKLGCLYSHQFPSGLLTRREPH